MLSLMGEVPNAQQVRSKRCQTNGDFPRDADWHCVITASEMVERSTSSNIHSGQLPAWERKFQRYKEIDMSKYARPEVPRSVNPLYQTRVRNLVGLWCIRGPAGHRKGCPSPVRMRVPIDGGSPTFSLAGSGSRLGRIDDDYVVHAYCQRGIQLARDSESRCGADHVHGSVGFDSAPDHHHSNPSGTPPSSAYVRDASNNRECCGAASR